MSIDERRIVVRKAAREAVHRLVEGEVSDVAELRAIRELQRTLPGMERDEIAMLRAAGRSWADIAEHTADPDGSNLFDRVAMARGPAFVWRCETCGQQVFDYGPQAYSHPDDLEDGHADGCSRRRFDVDQYEHGRDELDALHADEARAAADHSVWDET